MEAGAGEGTGVGQGLFETLGKGLFSARHSAKATLASGPIAWGEIAQHLIEPAGLQTCRQRLRGDTIRKRGLNATKAHPGSGVIAFQQIDFLKQKTEIGSELWHACVSVRRECARVAQPRRSMYSSGSAWCLYRMENLGGNAGERACEIVWTVCHY